MKIHYLFILAILFSSCAEEQPETTPEKIVETTPKQIVNEEIQAILDSAKLNGAVLIYDLEEDTYYSNSYKWCKDGKLPASTFKITNSIIALEAGIIKDDSTLLKWNGQQHRNKNWNQDLIFRDAFHFSCVPCYQDLARQIGVKKMKEYLEQLNYGNMMVDSSNLNLFWLIGDARINQFEQIDFLKRFYQAELPIAERTEKIMKRLMIIDQNKEYMISGKTGMSFSAGIDNGWFVGYVEKNNKTYFFATNVEPIGEIDFNTFPNDRKEVTYKTLQLLKIID
ncbi:MAG: class D beta-lactamase [Flavobacteriales bacterium]|nr:class D beta-lactamase [Flavobacteriales bacterium]